MNKFCDRLLAPSCVRDSVSFPKTTDEFSHSAKRLVLGLLIVPVLGGITGCVSSAPKKSAVKGEVQQEADAWRPRLGKIALVDEKTGFVLIDIGTAPAPDTGVSLRAYTAGGGSSELKVSAVQRRPYLIADIQKGHPQQGDGVVQISAVPGTKLEAPKPADPVAVKGPKKDASGGVRYITPPKSDTTKYVPVLVPEEPVAPVADGVIPGLPHSPKKKEKAPDANVAPNITKPAADAIPAPAAPAPAQ